MFAFSPRFCIPSIATFRVIVVEDGLCSLSNQAQDALMMLYPKRLTDPIELLRLDAVLDLRQEAL
jgi:hypothetical protein